ncbi:hypothetical protein [Geoglobus acetivorans]|uniref:Uncharacterized protein n=1 Tax=Geoglobus acetivorans TaxID=565033 RepID=A0A0A7GB02_GEOAI|nr:hypothetical protein GACE_0132 [Geoglobus acetivorans]
MKCLIVRERLHSYAKELEKGDDWNIPFISIELKSSSPETYFTWCNEMDRLEIISVRGEAGDELVEFEITSKESSVRILFNGDLAKAISGLIKNAKEIKKSMER